MLCTVGFGFLCLFLVSCGVLPGCGFFGCLGLVWVHGGWFLLLAFLGLLFFLFWCCVVFVLFCLGFFRFVFVFLLVFTVLFVVLLFGFFGLFLFGGRFSFAGCCDGLLVLVGSLG